MKKQKMKKALAGVLAVVLLLPVASLTDKESRVYATGNPYISITDADYASVSGEVARYLETDNSKCIYEGETYDMALVCPTNSNYYLWYTSAYNSWEERESIETIKLIKYLNAHPGLTFYPNEGDAYRWIIADGQNPDAEWEQMFLNHNKNSDTNYTSRIVSVVNGDSTVSFPAVSYDRMYSISGFKFGTGGTTLVRQSTEAGAYSFSLADYIREGYYDYYTVSTSFTIYDSDSESHVSVSVSKDIVPSNKLEVYKSTNATYLSKTYTQFVDEGPKGTMYRLYNPNSGEHFYTANYAEANHLVNVGWTYESHAWQAPEKSNTPVYRLYNPNSGEHHYTISEGEKNHLVSIGWNDEGIGWYSDDSKTTPLYRLYNPNAKGAQEAGAHHYTTSEAERNQLVSLGWHDEGIGWYGK